MSAGAVYALLAALALAGQACAASQESSSGPKLSRERAVFQTSFGDIEMAFYPEVAPITTEHIINLIRMGCYNSNHFFRVDKGFVAQTQDVASGRLVPLSPVQRKQATKTVPLEVKSGVKHHAGTLSMARMSDPDSGGSSFSILLGDAPHLDMQYAVFGRVLRGMGALRKMEEVETTRSGIFVMPKERINIQSTYLYYVADPENTVSTAWSFKECDLNKDLVALKDRVDTLSTELQKTREKCLPS
eukprot:TRINITY_DN21081_c0_g1_i1.p1 TRINITY_DN21081_c0_g1~~TRINITY_DN21081_c0_g1_i1.p1  ORF type:complete len:245 (-),score=19.74 TRINITY_DN21081_c0_g1_i1:445-1179(-)